MKKTVTWILLVDFGHARAFENAGPNKGLQEVQDFAFDAASKGHSKPGADQPGRTFDSAGEGRHSKEPHTDPVDVEHEEFMHLVAQKVSDVEKRGQFDRLILAAAPRALGILRAALPDPVKNKIVHELDKDLIKVPASELASHFEDVLPL